MTGKGQGGSPYLFPLSFRFVVLEGFEAETKAPIYCLFDTIDAPPESDDFCLIALFDCELTAINCCVEMNRRHPY